MHKKDTFLFGLLVGLVLPVLAYVVLYLGGILADKFSGGEFIIDKNDILLISIFVNLFPLRYYFVTLKFEQTGRGVILMTFVLGILFFIIR